MGVTPNDNEGRLRDEKEESPPVTGGGLCGIHREGRIKLRLLLIEVSLFGIPPILLADHVVTNIRGQRS
jgi:hypothetical protein